MFIRGHWPLYTVCILYGIFCTKSAPNSPFFSLFFKLLSIFSGFRGARGARDPGRAGGTHRLEGGQEGEIGRGPGGPGGVVPVGHVEVAVVGHQLAGPVAAPQHPGGGHAPGDAGLLGRAGVLGRGAGRLPRGTGGRTGRRAAAGGRPGPLPGPPEVTALVSFHRSSFLRRRAGGS